MPSHGLIALTLVTIVATVLCANAINTRYRDTTGLQQITLLPVFPQLVDRADTVTAIKVARRDQLFYLERSENNWINQGMGGYPADEVLVENLIEAFTTLRYVQPKTAQAVLYHKLNVGNVNPLSESTQVTLIGESDVPMADLIVGKTKETRTPGLQQVYIRLPDEQRAWLANGQFDVHRGPQDWSDHTIINITADAIDELIVEHVDGETVHLSRQSDGVITLLNIPDTRSVEHQYQIDYMTGLLESVVFDSARPVHQKDTTQDATTQPMYRVTVTTSDGLQIAATVVSLEPDGASWVHIAAGITDTSAAPEQVRQQAEALTTRFTHWQVRLPRKFADRLKIRHDDILTSNNRLTR